jgi:hypothetical protein
MEGMGLLGKARKGFIHIVEIVIVAIVIFFLIFQFLQIPPVNTEWSDAKLLKMGTDMLFALDYIGVDWLNTDEVDGVLRNAITLDKLRNTTMVFDLKVNGAVKPVIKVGCICKDVDVDDEFVLVKNALQPFYTNGRNISFILTYIDPAVPVFSHSHDVIIIMPDYFSPVFHNAHTLDDYNIPITNFLQSDKGILVIRDYVEADTIDILIDNKYFGVDWTFSAAPAGGFTFTHDTSYPNSSFYDVYKYFYSFPNSTDGVRIPSPYSFSSLLGVQENTTPSLLTSAECALEDNNGLCGLITNRGVISGTGRTAWLSRYSGPGSLEIKDDAETSVLLKSIIAWLAGDTHHVINNEEMRQPVVSRLYKMLQPPGLMAGYYMSEGAGSILYDSSGKTNHCSVIGSNWVKGKVDWALEFSGSGDFSNCGKDQTLDINTNFTISAWVNFSSLAPANDLDPFVSKDEGAGNQNKWIFGYADNYLGSVTDSTFFHIDDPVNPEVWIESTDWIPTMDQWYHVAVVKQDDDFTFYRNGQKQNTVTSAVSPPIIDFNMLIAKAESFEFNGTIDNVMIFNRALRNEEIRALYDFPDQLAFQPAEIILTLGYIY